MASALYRTTLDLLQVWEPAHPDTADAIAALWLDAERYPRLVGLTEKDRQALGSADVVVPALTQIGKALGSVARTDVPAYLPLVRRLWDAHGREGRIVAVHALGPMELADPERVLPVVLDLARTCVSWEDCDSLAMRALEPIVRKQPVQWLPRIDSWLSDPSPWVRRAGITVVARLPMVSPGLTPTCLSLTERLLSDPDQDVRRAVSFSIRMACRGDLAQVRAFLDRHVPPEDPAATWVLCDAIRSMTKSFLPELRPLLGNWERWAVRSDLSTAERRSVESALKVLGRV